MWFDEAHAASMGPIAPGDDSTLLDVAGASLRAAWYANNTNARQAATEAAFDRRSDAIFAATGERLLNPLRMKFATDVQSEYGIGRDQPTPMEEWDRRVSELAEKHPDKRAIINPELSPLDEAKDLARDSEEHLAAASAGYHGPWGTGTVASFVGGFAGSVNDPAFLLGLAAGPGGAAGPGVKGLAWMATKQAASNAAIEAAGQPFVAQWRKEAGLGYDAGDFATNVAMAGAFGFAADAGVRGGLRALNRARGRVPVLDKDGGIHGWEAPEAALDRAARASKVETLRKAADGDLPSMRKLAEEAGAMDDPVIRSAFDMAENVDATSIHHPDVHPDDAQVSEVQALRHLLDPDEPPPAPAPKLSEPPAQVDGEPDAMVAPTADVDSARARLADGSVDVIGAAQMMRDVPGVVDRSVPLDTPVLRDARAISQLSDPAFAMVSGGAVKPEHGALVARLVPDRERHASVLQALHMEDPKSPAEARRMIGALIADAPRADKVPEVDPHEPNGPSLDADIQRLERALGVKRAPETDERGLAHALPAIEGALMKEMGRGDPLVGPLTGIVSAYDTYGVAGVRTFLDGLAPATRRDLGARIAGDLQHVMPGLGEEAQARLLGARALARAARVLETAGEQTEAVLRLRQLAGDLERSIEHVPAAKGEVVEPRSAREGGQRAETAGSAAERARAADEAADALGDWRNHVVGDATVTTGWEAGRLVQGARSELERIETAIAAHERGEPPNGGRETLAELQQKRAAIEVAARKRMSHRAGEIARLRGEAEQFRGAARAEAALPSTVAHPDFPQLRLPVEPDGSVRFFRGQKADPGVPGPYTERMYTTNLQRAKDFAGPNGTIFDVKVEPARLKEAVPRSSSRDNPRAVKPGQDVFTLSREIVADARGRDVENSLRAKAIEAVPESDLQRGLGEADALERMRDLMKDCKL